MELTKLTSVEILGLTIIGEARGEPIEGQVAVGSVIRNRLHNNPTKYKSYHDVCLEPKQFSCWNEDDPNRVILIEYAEYLINGDGVMTDPYLKQCMFVALGIRDWNIVDNTKGALNYMTTKLFESDKKPSWAKNARNIREFGRQIFFNA